MSFADIPIIEPYFDYSNSDEIQLRVASDEDVDVLESEYKISMPRGYREYVITLGLGEYCDFVRIKLPFQILEEQAEYRNFIKRFYDDWEIPEEILPVEKALECIEIGTTNVGDTIIFHPANPDELFALPRHDYVFLILGDFYQALDYLCEINRNDDENQFQEFFVPWNKNFFGHAHKNVNVEEDWKPNAKISREVFKPEQMTAVLGIKAAPYTYSFSDTELDKQPVWQPEEGEPPVSVHQAVLIAKTQLPRFVANAHKYKVSSISLYKFGGNNWVYAITFNYAIDEIFQIFVKMDGLIVEPVTE